MKFLEGIFAQLQQAGDRPVIQEVRDGALHASSGKDFLRMVQQARQFFATRGLRAGDRCALIAANSIHWAAADLAMMAEGLIVVPLYVRQAPAELVVMLRDSSPARIICPEAAVAAEIKRLWPEAPKIALLESVFVDEEAPVTQPFVGTEDATVTIIYTSGTSGEPKGVMLTAANVAHMVSCTNQRLDQLMGAQATGAELDAGAADKIFHYLPFCFAGSWILLLTALSRKSVLTLSMDLTKLSDELKLASPDYFLNVPTLLERVRTRIQESIMARGGFATTLFKNARDAYFKKRSGNAGLLDSLWLSMGNSMLFPTIRANVGPNLKAIICGSAPLAIETQLFFMMIGIPVLQVYGLTETTAICTMDDPKSPEPGRVGSAISGVEMKVGQNEELLVRGENIFAGYWQKPDATAKAMEGGWFHTGDQGDVNAAGNWRITGRIKNLIILNSGHNVAPEPLEDAIAAKVPEAGQFVLVGNERGYLAALVTAATPGAMTLSDAKIQAAMDAVNAGAPHYKQIRAFVVVSEPFTIENGLLTANGKLKRDAIAARYASEIEAMYAKAAAVAAAKTTA
jgi:long-chain acyl-CoA synthetase